MPSRIGRWPRRQALGMGSGSPREWVFVQKCLLERKRSYLTEKGLFSRKAPYGGPRISNPLPLCLRVCRLRRDDDPNISPWHTHNCDQVLVVTSGSGKVATEHEQREINVGDVVHIKAGERHWHGATADTTMGHITITLIGSQATHG